MEKRRPPSIASSTEDSSKSPSKVSGNHPSQSNLPSKKASHEVSEKQQPPSRLKRAKEPPKKPKGECFSLPRSSGTQFFAKDRYDGTYVRITTDEYFGISESMSGSSDTFHCVHGPEGKLYTEKGLLKRNILKELDPIPIDRDWNDKCPPAYGWDLAKKLEFIITDPVAVTQIPRLEAHLRDFAALSCNGYRVDVLDSVCVVIDYLVEILPKMPSLKAELVKFLVNLEKPILLTAASDVSTCIDKISLFIGFMGYLLIRMETEETFNLVSKALIYQLSAPNSVRGSGTARVRHIMPVAGPVLYQTIVRMLAVADAYKFSTFLEVALILASYSEDNCLSMMKENIIENIFFRFNPYFPGRCLPHYDVNPADPQDYNVKLGESSVNINTTLSLLLILTKATKEYLEQNPTMGRYLPSPDSYSQRCFIWAYRYECRARGHQHQRTTLTVVVAVLLKCFGDRLAEFGSILMPDIMSLAVFTEVPLGNDWIGGVNFNATQPDVQFKTILINTSVNFIKVFSCNKYMIEDRYWLLGLMYLVDPGLCHLRANWSSALFAQIRKVAIIALVSVLPLTPPRLAVEYGLTRRIMWYIEWYSENPFELPVLYWCIRLLQVIVENRDKTEPKSSLNDLFDTHGIIIIIHLCYTLLKQILPPVEKAQAIISLCLRLLTSAVDLNRKLSCCVYPSLRWPSSINGLVEKMLNTILYSLNNHFIISERWLVALLNFIWEAVIWNNGYRPIFIANNGIYKLLDLITITGSSVQCIALALVCDVARAGDAVGQLVTWRASLKASQPPKLVKRGASISTLLAAIFREECKLTGVKLDENGIIQDLDYPLQSSEVRAAIYHPNFANALSYPTQVSLVAGDLAGSRLSKVFAILHMLSDDLEYAVSLADESYNMYKNIKLAPTDETILVLCSNYLVLKLSEVWLETKILCRNFLQEDNDTLLEFLNIAAGWTKEIKRQQEDVIETDKKKEQEEESSLHSFLGRVRLNIALDALREVRCSARSADRWRMLNGLIHDAVLAHHRRSLVTKRIQAPLLRTYGPKLDDQNITGQYVKVYGILPKNKPQQRSDLNPS